MTLVGFRRMHIVVRDGVTKEHFVVEGKENEGATSTAEITGLSKEPLKIWGSDGVYTVLAKGTGEVSVNLGVLDLLKNVNTTILGYQQTNDGFTKIGQSTNPPVCSIVLESSDLRDEPVYFGFFKGKFSKETLNLNTKTGENNEPEPEAYVYSPFDNDEDGELQGEIGLVHYGKEKEADFLAHFGIAKANTGE